MLDVAKERWSGFLTPVVALAYLLDPVNIVKFGRDSSIMELAEQFIRDSYKEEMATNVIRSLWSYLNRVDGFTESAFLIADGEGRVGSVWGSKPECWQSAAHIRRVGELVCFSVHSQPASEQADGRPSSKVGLFLATSSWWRTVNTWMIILNSLLPALRRQMICMSNLLLAVLNYDAY